MYGFKICGLHLILLGYEIKGMMGETCSTHGREGYSHISDRISERVIPLGEFGHKWENDIKMNV
jgi:hypothetical protein